MLDTLFKTLAYFIEHIGQPVHRGLMDQIDWRQPLIGIMGARGVGHIITLWLFGFLT